MPKVYKKLTIKASSPDTISDLESLDLEHRMLLGWLMFGRRYFPLKDAITVVQDGRKANMLLIRHDKELRDFYDDKVLYFNNRRVV